ncbi:MAG: phosphoglycerate dehydrogenase [Clostridiales bacterium]|nr:phosphoglycerate dehydrogenase [Clostridiales bacterium]
MKVLITVKISDEQLEKIKSLGYEIIRISESKIKNCEEVDDADILVTYNPFKRLDISKMKNLKYIMLTSVGFDQLPKEKVIKQNIQVTNNRGGYSISMSEWIVMCILEIYKKSKMLYKQQQDKVWHMDFGISELYGSRIGFLGTGTIAVEAAKRLNGFGVEIWGYNTNGREVEYFDRCFGKNQINEIFKNCDVVVSTMPCTENTIGMIDKDKFELMKQGSSFINVGRGKIVNEEDLIKYLDKFKGVALDVFEQEPLPKESPLWDADNVIVTPHNCWVSDKNDIRVEKLMYSNLKKYKEGKQVDNIVNIERGY